jgi:hypothetical protein
MRVVKASESTDATRSRQRERMNELTRVACANKVLDRYEALFGFDVVGANHFLTVY